MAISFGKIMFSLTSRLLICMSVDSKMKKILTDVGRRGPLEKNEEKCMFLVSQCKFRRLVVLVG